MKTGEPYTECTTADAVGYIDTYFSQFPQLKRWIEKCHSQIKNHGFIYSHFGRKRRLHNINSEDRGVQGEEIRSGFNAVIQGVSSDSLLLGAIDTDEEIIAKGLSNEMKIIMLVHDSVVAIVKEDLVDQYNEILIRNIQKDRGVSIPGCPIGIESDSEKGGSRDYSCGKMKKQHPSVSCIDDPDFTLLVKEMLQEKDFEYRKLAAFDKEHPEHSKYNDDLFIAVCKDLDNVKRVLGA